MIWVSLLTVLIDIVPELAETAVVFDLDGVRQVALRDTAQYSNGVIDNAFIDIDQRIETAAQGFEETRLAAEIDARS